MDNYRQKDAYHLRLSSFNFFTVCVELFNNFLKHLSFNTDINATYYVCYKTAIVYATDFYQIDTVSNEKRDFVAVYARQTTHVYLDWKINDARVKIDALFIKIDFHRLV